MRALATAVIVLAALAGPCYAQMDGAPPKNPLELQYEREKLYQQQVEKDYNAMMKGTRKAAPAAKADPWRTVRPAESTGSKR